MHCIALVLSLSASLVTASSTGPHRLHVSHLAGLYSYGAFGKSPTQSFYSSDATPPALNILTPLDARRYRNATGPTLYTFTGARGDDTAQPAPYIFDDSGELVWQGPLGGVLNSRKHTYKGQDVIAMYRGTEEFGGYGRGQWQIYDETYTLIATVEAQQTVHNMTDPHDFQITPEDTAVVEFWDATPTDLSQLGGPKEGWAWDCKVQEIDIASGKLLSQWSVLEHLPVTETFYSLLEDRSAGWVKEKPFDFAHLNSVQKDTAGRFLVGMRGPSTLYLVDGNTGDIIWRIGGARSDFAFEPDAMFHHQHDAKVLGSSASEKFLISLFDNEANQFRQIGHEARGLILEVDTTTMVIRKHSEFISSFRSVAPSEGSVQVLENGNVVVGWGIRRFYSEFTGDGKMIHNVEMGAEGSNIHSYRTTKHTWIGRPLTRPSFAVDTLRDDRSYASWNGATEVARWRLIGGNTPSRLRTIESISKEGFETTLHSPVRREYLAAAAFDKDGKCLGISDTHEWASGRSTGTAMSCGTLALEDSDWRLWTTLTLVLLLVFSASWRRCRAFFLAPVSMFRRQDSNRYVLAETDSPKRSPILAEHGIPPLVWRS